MNELFRRDEKIVLREVSQVVIYGPGLINGCAAPTLHYHRKKTVWSIWAKKIWHDLATIKQVSLKKRPIFFFPRTLGIKKYLFGGSRHLVTFLFKKFDLIKIF